MTTTQLRQGEAPASISVDARNPGAEIESATMVIFGITGDLARKKLMPAVYELASRGELGPDFDLVGFTRRPDGLHERLQASIASYAGRDYNPDVWAELRERIHPLGGSYEDPEAYRRLTVLLDSLQHRRRKPSNCLYHLSLPPSAFAEVSTRLDAAGLSRSRTGWRRVMVEKPLGHDLASARVIATALESAFASASIFRTDHYLGKEAVQNILALRFANRLFEPSWNNLHIDHVQITMAETIGVTGRASYYDGVGAARDVIQNHLLQLLALVAMEEPSSYAAAAVAAAKCAVLAASSVALPFDRTTARGQYVAGTSEGVPVGALTEEASFAADSATETYAALTVLVDSPRWSGVPFYLRTGKRLSRQGVEIVVTFRPAEYAARDGVANVLVLRLQPEISIELQIGAKQHGPGLQVQPMNLELDLRASFDAAPSAYERLIRDALTGDATLFPSGDEVERSWEIVDPVIEYWSKGGRPEDYPAGSDGPRSAARMLARDGRMWRSL
ncbi:glucose-6-phosphate dehydrogenase [Mycobacterium sp. MS1601]|uniref:glucose-6-phosphate dehydrogenase n=1 Tax=Mycobacterium sp. MS1601 TaxID=1936029 RepID=UPI0009FB1CAB|nr:glucose-6-phosphate dehydrogenase [Mycobacterium sp. MS1601]